MQWSFQRRLVVICLIDLKIDKVVFQWRGLTKIDLEIACQKEWENLQTQKNVPNML